MQDCNEADESGEANTVHIYQFLANLLVAVRFRKSCNSIFVHLAGIFPLRPHVLVEFIGKMVP